MTHHRQAIRCRMRLPAHTVRHTLIPVAALIFLLIPDAPARGQSAAAKFVGPAACTPTCHKVEIGALQKHKHSKSLEVFESKKAGEIAKKLNVSDPYASDLCLKCHATKIGSKEPEFGVSCESCHGGAEKWEKVHGKEDDKERMKKARSLGMADPRNPSWSAPNCFGCHGGMTGEMVAAGHPVKLDLEMAKELAGSLRHWEKPRPESAMKKWRAAEQVAGLRAAVDTLARSAGSPSLEKAAKEAVAKRLDGLKRAELKHPTLDALVQAATPAGAGPQQAKSAAAKVSQAAEAALKYLDGVK